MDLKKYVLQKLEKGKQELEEVLAKKIIHVPADDKWGMWNIVLGKNQIEEKATYLAQAIRFAEKISDFDVDLTPYINAGSKYGQLNI